MHTPTFLPFPSALKHMLCFLHTPCASSSHACKTAQCCLSGLHTTPTALLQPMWNDRLLPCMRAGHGTNIIAGVGLGLESTAAPTLVLSVALIASYWLGNTSGAQPALHACCPCSTNTPYSHPIPQTWS